MAQRERIGAEGVDALILDLDGVLTDTAKAHAAAWKRAFDEYLVERAGRAGGQARPFDAEEDYRRHVDGKPRYEGVAAFLRSRGIELPWGRPDDPPGAETVCGLGNRKNAYYLEVLDAGGAEVFGSSLLLAEEAAKRGVRTAVVTSSRNGRRVLAAAGIPERRFDLVVDGTDAERWDVRGKPEPDLFVEAARRLGVPPEHTAVVEDSRSGVEAGRRGGFGLVVGVDRSRAARALRDGGADVVVRDLGDPRAVRAFLGCQAEEAAE